MEPMEPETREEMELYRAAERLKLAGAIILFVVVYLLGLLLLF